jgi:type I restriction enzyme, S subunit
MSSREASAPLPSGWEIQSLGDVVSRVTRRNNIGNTNVLTISARDGLINQEEFFNKRVASADLSQYLLLSKGDFAYNKSYSAGYPVGVVRRLDRYPRGVVSPLYICFRPNPQCIDSDYLVHYFQSGLLDGDIAWIAKEGARNHGLLNVSIKDMLSLPVRVPSLAEQRYVADVLDTVDATIRSTERLIAKIEMFKQGILHDLLNDGLDDSGQLRDPKLEPDLFVRTPFGLSPKKWEITGIRGVADVFNGSTPSRVRRDYWDGGTIPWLSSGKVNDYEVVNPSELITDRAVRECSLRLLPAGSVIVGMIGEGRTRGMTARLGISATINQNLAGIIPSQKIDGRFLHIFLSYHYEALRSGGRGSNQDALNTKLVADFKIAVPGLREQHSVMRIVDAMLERSNAEYRELRKLRLLKQGLMRDLLSGRVRMRSRAVSA